jgi:hypothetical protein
MLGIWLQLIAFISFISYIIYRFGVIKSISNSYYLLEPNRRFLFTIFCWAIGFPLIFLEGRLFFLSAVGFIFTGVAADYKIPQLTYKYILHIHAPQRTMVWWIHHIGAGIGILFSFLGLWINFGHPELLIIFLISTLTIYLFNINNKLWWIEIIAFILILFGLFKYTYF